MSNVQTVQDIYSAFGRGDVAAITSRVTEHTHWDFVGGRPDRVPWHRPATSRDALPGFFAAIAEHVEFAAFEPKSFVHAGADVAVTVRLVYVVKRTGRTVEIEQVHWWTFEDGKVARMRHYEDTATVLAAVA